MRHRRVLLVFISLLGSLTAVTGRSIAQDAGAELAEAIAADAAGTDAYVVLQSVEAFPSAGGNAVFEPGTQNEEVFSYASVDPSKNRLVGLTRPAPLAHPAGAFVEAPSSDSGDPGATPVPAEPSPSPSETTGDSDTAGSDSSSAEASESADTSPPDACEIATDQTCDDLLGPIIGDPPSTAEVCAELKSMCEEAQQLINDLDELETGDPCDPDHTGQTCIEYVRDLLGQFLNDDPCDPSDTGQTCEQYVQAWLVEKLAPLLTDCEVSDAVCNEIEGLLYLIETCSNVKASLCEEIDLLVEMVRAIGAAGVATVGGDVNLTPYETVYFAPDDLSRQFPECALGPCGPTCARRWYGLDYYWSETKPGIALRAILFWCWEKGEVTHATASWEHWVSSRAEKVVDVSSRGQTLDVICDAGKCKMAHTVARWLIEYTYCSGKPPHVKCDSYYEKHPLIRISGFAGGAFENSGKDT
jgi:hypothetical protein